MNGDSYVHFADKEYILNKYHDTSKPFNGFGRFIRRDALFDPASGMEPESLYKLVEQNDIAAGGAPHSLRKARAIYTLLENTRICCDSRDRFPAINIVDRPLKKCIVDKWKKEVFQQIIPETGKLRTQLENDGIVTIWPDYDHSVPVWERVFRRGFTGLYADAKAAMDTLESRRPLTPEESAFYESVFISCRAFLLLCARLEKLASDTPGARRMAAALGALQHRGAQTVYEALLQIYLYFMVSEHVDNLQVRSLGNLDAELYPFYLSDLSKGVTEDEIRTDLAYFFMQFTAIGNYWNQPFYLGGNDAEEKSLINPLSYIILDVYDRMGIYNPKIQIKTNENTPKEFVLKALDMIRRGHSCIVFVSDSTVRSALEKAGATPEEARTCHIKGCYEYSVDGSLDTGMNYVNLLKPLEYCMHGGNDGITGKAAGLTCPLEYDSFDAFFAEYKRQLAHLCDTAIEVVNSFENYFDNINPQPLLSSTFPSCIEQGRDAFGGGALYNDSSMSFGFIANLSDSLTQIKRLVFDEKKYTLQQLRGILDSDFAGNEKLRMSLLHNPEKYGNNREIPDAFARDITSFISGYICGKHNAARRGGRWNCGFHIARMVYIQAPLTASTPDGRLRGEELSKNVSASMGQNREGITAAILSSTKIDASAFCGDAALDAGLLPSAVRGQDGLEAMYGLLMTFIGRGGQAIQFNVFDADTLRAAQANPEQYRDLQIRVSGWNVLFNNIKKEEQDGFIRQAEALV